MKISNRGPLRALLLLSILSVLLPVATIAQPGIEVRRFVSMQVDESGLIDQKTYSNKACGPAAMLNALKFGSATYQKAFSKLPGRSDGEKLRHVIDEIGSRASVERKKRPRFNPESGVSATNLLQMYLDVLGSGIDSKVIAGRSLDRQRGESDGDLLRRIHNVLVTSISAGIAPVVHLWPIIPNLDTKKWDGSASHFVVVTSVPESIDRNESGFAIRYIDPMGARVRGGYLHIESARRIPGITGTQGNYSWTSGSPFLLAEVPSLHSIVRQIPWSSRTAIQVHYAIGVFGPKG